MKYFNLYFKGYFGRIKQTLKTIFSKNGNYLVSKDGNYLTTKD